VLLYYAAVAGASALLWRLLPAGGRDVLRDALTHLTSATQTVIGFGAPVLQGAAPPRVSSAVVVGLASIAAFLLAVPVAWTYMWTRRTKGYRQSVVHSLVLLPVVVAGVVVLVKNNVALAFSLAGIVAAVRFRNTLDDSKDAVFIFFATILGLAAGVQVDAAVALSMLFIAVVLILWYADFARMPPGLEEERAQRQLERAMAIANRTSEFVARIDREVLEAMAPAQLDALAQRVKQRRTDFEADGMAPEEPAKARFAITVPDAGSEATRSAIERVIETHCKRWHLSGTQDDGNGGDQVLEYIVTIRKSRTLDELSAAVERLGMPHVIRTSAERMNGT
jgi:hypothetical protein